jgi:hypothetical protein
MTTLEILQNRAGTAKRLQTIFAYHYDQILNAYPKEETEEEPFISFTLENIKYNLYID